MKKPKWDRRDFLEFIGIVGAGAACPGLLYSIGKTNKGVAVPFRPLAPTFDDRVALAESFSSTPLISWGEEISEGVPFGYNSDFTCFLPLKAGGEDDGLLFVNHEFVEEGLFNDWQKRTKVHAEKERGALGASIVRIKRDKSGRWKVVKNDPLNARFDGRSKIPFSGGHTVSGSRFAVGTFANCSGGQTPWKTFLTCEENVDDYYATPAQKKNGQKGLWDDFFNLPYDHYGWVVEIDPFKKQAKKLVGLGRFSHEGALVVSGLKNQKTVVYMGDDANDQCLYKFVASDPDSLEHGTLYVANIDTGRWIPLEIQSDKRLKEAFKSQVDLLVNTREAAALVGGTPLDRPEGITRNPLNGDIIVSLTNNTSKGNHYGSLLKITEESGKHDGLKFRASTLLTGGLASGVSCPDNILFDQKGGLWVATDISSPGPGSGRYAKFGNNSLFYIPPTGPNAGVPLRVASAPRDAEFTGMSFAPDGETMFISVQHPGGKSKSLSHLNSHWPDGGRAKPRSAVVTISGQSMKKLIG